MQEASPQEGVKSSDELAEIVDYIYRQIKDIED